MSFIGVLNLKKFETCEDYFNTTCNFCKEEECEEKLGYFREQIF